MHTAGVALLFGQDPLHVLTQAPGDAAITVAALEVARTLRRDYDEAFIKALSRATGAEVGRVVGKQITRLVRQLTPG